MVSILRFHFLAIRTLCLHINYNTGHLRSDMYCGIAVLLVLCKEVLCTVLVQVRYVPRG